MIKQASRTKLQEPNKTCPPGRIQILKPKSETRNSKEYNIKQKTKNHKLQVNYEQCSTDSWGLIADS